MSRIGKLPISIPDKVDVKLDGGVMSVKGPKGELSQPVSPELSVEIKDGTITVDRPTNERNHRSLHGLTRTLINNMVVGVTEGFSKALAIEGVGYRAEMRGNTLVLALGYSHPIVFMPPEGIALATPTPNRIEISGADKVMVGEVAAKIRSFRKPEPYKGKGIRYENEVVRRKAGKTAK